MKVLILLALVAASSAVPMKVFLAEHRMRAMDTPDRDFAQAPAEKRTVERVQIVESPVFAVSDAKAEKVGESPADSLSGPVHSVELPPAPQPAVNVAPRLQNRRQSLRVFGPIDEPLVLFGSGEKQGIEVGHVRVVESPADEHVPLLNAEAPHHVKVTHLNEARESVKRINAPAFYFPRPAVSEAETIRVVRPPSAMEMAR